MSEARYRISQQAIEDLEHIWVHTFHKWSKEQADNYYNFLIDRIEFITIVWIALHRLHFHRLQFHRLH